MNKFEVLSNKDHDLIVGFQQKHGITIGDFLEVLERGTVYVLEQNNQNEIKVSEEAVRPSSDGTWLFVNPRPEIGKGRNMRALGETYTLNADDMERIAVKRWRDDIKAISTAIGNLVGTGCDISALSAERDRRKKILDDYVGPSKVEE